MGWFHLPLAPSLPRLSITHIPKSIAMSPRVRLRRTRGLKSWATPLPVHSSYLAALLPREVLAQDFRFLGRPPQADFLGMTGSFLRYIPGVLAIQAF